MGGGGAGSLRASCSYCCGSSFSCLPQSTSTLRGGCIHAHSQGRVLCCTAPFCAKSLRLTKEVKQTSGKVDKEHVPRYHWCCCSRPKRPGHFWADTLRFAALMSPPGCRGAVGRSGPAETTETASVTRGKAGQRPGY